MMVKFIYRSDDYDPRKETLIKKVFAKAKKLIKLPDILEVEFKILSESTYAETIVDHRFKNRIILNSKIGYKDIIIPTVHELLHLHQIHTGKLSSARSGIIIWENKPYKINSLNLNYRDYKNLPWELDVAEKEKKLLQDILN